MRQIIIDGEKPNEKWLREANRLTKELIAAVNAGDIEKRNQIIDKNSKHWGKLKKWLMGLSFNKCWFSETRDNYSHLDVEHFRPKKEAKQDDGTLRDGYWWLAFAWENYRICGNVGNRKKGGYFPLRDGSPCADFGNQCVDDEVYYLLDPVTPGDPELLAFNEEGNAIPAPGIGTWDIERVEVTIKRMKLNEHEPLVEARRDKWQEMSNKIETFLREKSKLNDMCSPVAKERVRQVCLEIQHLADRKSPLSSVAQWCVRFRNDPQLLALI